MYGNFSYLKILLVNLIPFGINLIKQCFQDYPIIYWITLNTNLFEEEITLLLALASQTF